MVEWCGILYCQNNGGSSWCGAAQCPLLFSAESLPGLPGRLGMCRAQLALVQLRRMLYH